MEWDAENCEELRRLWDEKLSASAIAAHFKTSKNAVLGKARRIGCPTRRSPIICGRTLSAEQIERLGNLLETSLTRREIADRLGCSIHVLDVELKRQDVLRSPAPKRRSVVFIARNKPVPVLRTTPVTGSRPPVQKAIGRTDPCCWPIGEPGKPSFHYCNGTSMRGRPYCQDHASIAYVRAHDRREDGA